MSVHLSPAIVEDSRDPCMTTALQAFSLDGRPGASPAGRVPRSIPTPVLKSSAGSPLSIKLSSMGLLLALYPNDREATKDAAPGQADKDARLAALYALGDAEALRASSAADPVMRQLSQVLGAAGATDDPASGLFADALHLALVARLLVIQGLGARPAARSAEASHEPNREPRRGQSRLLPWRLKRVAAFVDAHLSEAVTLADMAQAAGLSRMHFAAQFRATTGLRPHEYLLKRRIERAQQMMRESREPLVQIALSVGFQTQAHFTTVFRRFAGAPPHRWRSANGGAP